MGLVELIKSWFGGGDCKYVANILGKRICVNSEAAAAIRRQKFGKTQEYYSNYCNKIGKVPIEIKKFGAGDSSAEYILCKYQPKK